MRGIKFFGIVFVLLGLVLWSGCANTPSNSPESSSERIASASTLPSAWSSVTPSENASQPSSSSIGVQVTSYSTVSHDDGQYKYDKHGHLIGFNIKMEDIPSNIASDTYLSQDDMRCLAEEYLVDKIPLGKYTLTKVQDKPYQCAVEFQYHREVDGYKCFDFAIVSVTYDGTIVEFFAPRVGAFDNLTIPEINEERLLERLDVMMKEKFGDIPYTEFEERRSLSILQDGSFAMYMEALPDGMEEIYTWSFYVPIE